MYEYLKAAFLKILNVKEPLNNFQVAVVGGYNVPLHQWLLRRMALKLVVNRKNVPYVGGGLT